MSGRLASAADFGDEQAEALARGGIATVWEALQASVENLSARAPGVPAAEHADAQKKLIDLHAPGAVPANVLWAQRERTACMVRTCTALDELTGGIMTGEVLELAGRSGSGKTWLCLAACAYASLQLRASVLYVDVGRNFSARAFHSECMRLARALSLPENSVSLAMRRVRVVHAYEADELVATLEHAHGAFFSGRTAAAADVWYSQLGLVVVDSVALALMPLCARDSAGQSWIVSVSRALRQLARSNVAVLITNQLVGAETPLVEGVFEDNARLALGGSWRGVSDVRVYLEERRGPMNSSGSADKPATSDGLQAVAFRERSQRAPGGEWIALRRSAV